MLAKYAANGFVLNLNAFSVYGKFWKGYIFLAYVLIWNGKIVIIFLYTHNIYFRLLRHHAFVLYHFRAHRNARAVFVCSVKMHGKILQAFRIFQIAGTCIFLYMSAGILFVLKPRCVNSLLPGYTPAFFRNSFGKHHENQYIRKKVPKCTLL